MMGLNDHDTNFIIGGLIGIFLGILGFIFARALAVFNLKPSPFLPKDRNEKMIKMYTIYTKIVALLIVIFCIYEILVLLKKAIH